jgi:hypothetical protein
MSSPVAGLMFWMFPSLIRTPCTMVHIFFLLWESVGTGEPRQAPVSGQPPW